MIHTEHFKNKLNEELGAIESELGSVGRKAREENKTEWLATDPDTGKDSAEDGEVADNFTEYENNTAVFDQLMRRRAEIKEALARIENNTYGTCSVCGKEIEADRLEANPAATTCKQHME